MNLGLNMAIPPFPSQDLAKLVLGYLAEEQLMTAYDEFLQASPYLDASGNEFDRIFMTSLKNILAEYRAVKIHVETCKPFVLRKKLLQSPNLLEMVKFMIQHIDVSKIHDNQNKCGYEKFSAIVNNCEVCKSFNQDICTCNRKNQHSSNMSRIPKYEQSESSVETTPLTDLPGNFIKCKQKKVRVLDTEDSDFKEANNTLEYSVSHSNNTNEQLRLYHSDVLQNDSLVKCSDSSGLNQKEEFNHILNQVCQKNQSSSNIDSNINNLQTQRVSVEGYSNFATGVMGGDNRNTNVPDSSTSENMNLQKSLPKDKNKLSNLHTNLKLNQTRTQYLLKVANANKPNEIVSINTISTCTLPRLKSKIDDSKIKILSDVKVDKSNNELLGNLKMPQVLKNATSTPLLQMQTIVINGTPVYKQKPLVQKQNFTKDEIMAMPTIILAPVSGTQKASENVITVSSACSTAATTTTMSSSTCQLGPLVIDVNSATNFSEINSKQGINMIKQNETEDTAMSKIIDITSASAPKDNTVTALAETNTPQVVPPLRKSSSTPRRTSHVRVLDFATPRRILHETINKCPISTTSNDLEVVIGNSPNNNLPLTTNVIAKIENIEVNTDSSKENSVKTKSLKKRHNWDADLRALAITHKKDIEVQSSVSTSRPKSVKKRKVPKNQVIKKDINEKNKNKEDPIKSRNHKKSSKSKEIKNILEPISEVAQLPQEKVDIPIKPNINIIAGTDRSVSDNDKSQNRSDTENADTPEMERIALQNEIGAKLNISDLLETPYKQVLYDIQMETPRFLGPDITDDPLSAVKIMSIPTPRFLNDPTPSSYSSRPTDYSSGGSYYKPDDQDYMRIADDLECPVSTSTNIENNTKQEIALNKATDNCNHNENNKEKPSRPVRKCTKNVSYYKNNSNLNNKTNEAEDKNADSSFSDTDINSSFYESCHVKEIKSNKDNKSKHQFKPDRKATPKIRKTPVKKEVSKSFMKIKPRRPTPVKKDIARKKRKTPENPKGQTRKKDMNKEVGASITPVVVPVPTKSRRKSSTPRKLHCTKTFNSESSEQDSPELLQKPCDNAIESNVPSIQDSDTEHLPLRWSDDGSQDTKLKEIESQSNNDIEDMNKIQDYIKTVTNKTDTEGEGSLHKDLVKRGFDLETAKIIERELLDASPQCERDSKDTNIIVTPLVENVDVFENKINNINLEKTLESDCSTRNNLQIVQGEDDEADEIELSVHECNEESTNYVTCIHDDTKDVSSKEVIKLKDKFSMEVCLDDDLSIRLRATAFSLLFDQNPEDNLQYQNQHETNMAVHSISNIDKLNTPLKKSMKAQCYEIFDSTLTSLDTPLKVNSPSKDHEVTVTEIVLEVKQMEVKEKIETRKRRRVQGDNLSDDCSNDSKKSKPEEAQYLLNSANIQNIDIESVLSKLHGP